MEKLGDCNQAESFLVPLLFLLNSLRIFLSLPSDPFLMVF